MSLVVGAGAAGASAPNSGSPNHASAPAHRAPVAVHSSAAPKHLLGVDVWWIKRHNISTRATETQRARQITKYIRNWLHGNAVAINFPLYVSSPTSERVFTTSSTPSWRDIRLFILAARHNHLVTEIRPLLNVGTSAYGWRGKINPPNLKKFFHSYFEVLKPYLRMAEKLRVPYFVYASELWQLSIARKYVSAWAYLRHLIKGVYRGNLEYDSSGVPFRLRQVKVPGYGNYTDAYFQVNATWKAPERVLYNAWMALLDRLPRKVLRNTVFQEVGFATVAKGYRIPSIITSGHTKKKYLFMQGRWFSMVCHVMHSLDTKGAFFWTLYFAKNPYSYHRNGLYADPTTWANRPGGRAIASCFKHFG